MSGNPAPPSPQRPVRPSRRLVLFSVVLGVVLAGVLGAVMAVTLSSHTAAPSVPASFDSFDKPVPPAVEDLPLVNEHGLVTSLGAFKGKMVVFADFLTSCQDECPISTGALLEISHALVADHLSRQIVIVEATVDPARDSAARLLAYEQYTGVDWALLTGTPQVLAKLWSFFGASYEKVVEDDPPGINWQTGKPYTYDVDHSNDLYVLDRSGDERLLTQGLPNVHGVLAKQLHSLLSPLGIKHLDHPGFGAWTVPQLAQALGYLLGRPVAISGS